MVENVLALYRQRDELVCMNIHILHLQFLIVYWLNYYKIVLYIQINRRKITKIFARKIYQRSSTGIAFCLSNILQEIKGQKVNCDLVVCMVLQKRQSWDKKFDSRGHRKQSKYDDKAMFTKKVYIIIHIVPIVCLYVIHSLMPTIFYNPISSFLPFIGCKNVPIEYLKLFRRYFVSNDSITDWQSSLKQYRSNPVEAVTNPYCNLFDSMEDDRILSLE